MRAAFLSITEFLGAASQFRDAVLEARPVPVASVSMTAHRERREREAAAFIRELNDFTDRHGLVVDGDPRRHAEIAEAVRLRVRMEKVLKLFSPAPPAGHHLRQAADLAARGTLTRRQIGRGRSAAQAGVVDRQPDRLKLAVGFILRRLRASLGGDLERRDLHRGEVRQDRDKVSDNRLQGRDLQARGGLESITHSDLSCGLQPGEDAESPAGENPAGGGAPTREPRP